MTAAKDDGRLERIVEALASFAKGDFSARAPVSDALDMVDAIATGLNMMAEELDGAVASHREIELAYRNLQEAQARLLHSAKLVSIGQLAAGVAHEINNPAAWVALAVTLAKKRAARIRVELRQPPAESSQDGVVEALDELDTELARIAEGIDRIHGVARDLLTFARADGGEETALVLLDEVVRATVNLVEPAIRPRVELRVVLGEVPPVRGNPGRLGQVVTNLVVNSAEALERAGTTGTVTVRTVCEADDAVLTVEDDGPGIPASIAERVFDPFFSTHAAGTGLGLSLVAEIVKRHGGTIRVVSPPPGGAVVEVRLPLAHTSPPQASVP